MLCSEESQLSCLGKNQFWQPVQVAKFNSEALVFTFPSIWSPQAGEESISRAYTGRVQVFSAQGSQAYPGFPGSSNPEPHCPPFHPTSHQLHADLRIAAVQSPGSKNLCRKARALILWTPAWGLWIYKWQTCQLSAQTARCVVLPASHVALLRGTSISQLPTTKAGFRRTNPSPCFGSDCGV